MEDRVVLVEQSPSLRAGWGISGAQVSSPKEAGMWLPLTGDYSFHKYFLVSAATAKTGDTGKDRADIDWHMPEGKNVKVWIRLEK